MPAAHAVRLFAEPLPSLSQNKFKTMDIFEKAKLALRKHLLANKEQVKADLDEMRSKSVGNDIDAYLLSASGFRVMTKEEIELRRSIAYEYLKFDK